MEHLFTVENLIALLTLTAMEIVLGIDTIVFLAILNLVNVAIPMITVKTLAQVATWLCQLMLSMARSCGDEHGE